MSRKNHPKTSTVSSRAVPPPSIEPHPGAALVPRNGRFEGQVAIVGETLIDGAVKGSLHGPGTLRLGSSAQIEGTIQCEKLDSEGQILGKVKAKTHARLGPGTQLEGDLEAPVLEVDEDAIWNGRAKVGA